jgi:hypothetical protein
MCNGMRHEKYSFVKAIAKETEERTESVKKRHEGPGSL